MALATLLDLIHRNNSDPVVGLIDETAKVVPEINLLTARTIKGVSYDTQVRTENPAVGFRAANEGSDYSWGKTELRHVATHILNPRWAVDKAIADASEDGPEAMMADEAQAKMTAAWSTIASQMYYGLKADPNRGFPGLVASYDAANMTVDAGGTTDNVASSVWGIKYGTQGVQWVLGQDGDIKPSEVRIQDIISPSNNLPFTGYVQEILARVGLQVGNLKGVGRIKKLTTDSGKGLTDLLLAQLIGLFPIGMKPDVLLMSQRSLMQLQASRTTYSPTGQPAPFPEEAFGIPIWPTDAILNTEKLAL